MAKIIILLCNIIKFLMFPFNVLTIFHEMCEYFYFFKRISLEFCVFDLDHSFLFFISSYHFLRNTWLQRHYTVEYGILFLRFPKVIDISHDPVLSEKHDGKKHISPVRKKEVLSRRIIQKEVSFRSSQVKI